MAPKKKVGSFDDDVGKHFLEVSREQWKRDEFRDKINSIIREHENTNDFTVAVEKVVERYQKIKTSERVMWIVIGVVGAGITAIVTLVINNLDKVVK